MRNLFINAAKAVIAALSINATLNDSLASSGLVEAKAR